jgi:hypothetical protein
MRVRLDDTQFTLPARGLIFRGITKSSPNYHLARVNLAIAHNSYGLAIRDKPNHAIQEFHKAILLDGNNETTRQNLGGIIRLMGRSSSDYKVRLELAEEAQKQKDFVS